MDYFDSHNELQQQSNNSLVEYLHWGGAVEARSFGDKRISAEDHYNHYGLEARLVFLQMLTNVLAGDIMFL